MMKNEYINIRETTEEEHRQTMELMEPLLDIQDNPKVGLFFYDPNRNVLYGEVASLVDGLVKNQDGLVVVRTSHREIWDKGVRKQWQKYKGEGPFKGEYEDTHRGYVAYNSFMDVFELHVGNWYEQYPKALNEIIEEFDLSGCNIKTIIERIK